MDSSQSQSDPEEEMSFEKNISQDFSTDGYSGSRHRTFGRERGGFPHHRLVILSLGLLNAVLLIAAIVIGIYCAKAKHDYLLAPDSAAAPLIIEMNYLRNYSSVIKAKVDAQTELHKRRANHVTLKMQVKEQKIITDRLQGQIETLNKEKANLDSNKTLLEENCGRCRPGWLFRKSSCYYFSSLHASNSKKNWMDSRAHCKSEGGDLLVIDNLEEQLLIGNNLPKMSSSSLWWQNGFWIGLTDVVTEGTWVWINNVTEVQTMYWKDGYPNNDGRQSARCAALLYYADGRKTWYNGHCQNHHYNWICEMEPNLTPQITLT
ncbi:C-type lectin domain family 4 member M CD209 antigen-like protein 1 [Collichthys lucidus]|uniref:C-type lectin domain family 4 member M CD209 antigen-like protein 1 n=1 Tax=Collichthys lucidus TaxID=240159 RepID=A0A4U5VER0_COLLU|nr:C-type lectin domain family 4 member M CD209 antigen-like protein 1 [Collichthys lucidus]